MTTKLLTLFLAVAIMTTGLSGCGSGVATSGSGSVYMQAGEGKIANVRDALQRGFGVNTQDDDGRTLLHYAIVGNQLNVAEMLIVNFGANPTIKDNDGYAAVDYALEGGDPNMLEMLYNEGYLQ